jgi:ATP-binding cassette subfamily B protein
MDFISNIIATINIVLALFLGYFYFKQNVITIGDFVLLFVMITRINDELRYLVYNYREFNRSLVDVEKYINILEEEPNIKEPETKIKINNINPTIELRKVTFNYPDNTNQVFKNLSFKIKPKEKIALVGKSGAGKTTIITLLLRFYDVVSGGIYINGQNIKDFKKEELRSLFGTVPQDPIMFNETIKYNVCYGKSEATMAELIMACKLANIYNFIDSLPAKFETQVGERGIKLSGGQKQRLAIARVILSNPQIIIFDEATSQLDSESEKEIQDAF